MPSRKTWGHLILLVPSVYQDLNINASCFSISLHWWVMLPGFVYRAYIKAFHTQISMDFWTFLDNCFCMYYLIVSNKIMYWLILQYKHNNFVIYLIELLQCGNKRWIMFIWIELNACIHNDNLLQYMPSNATCKREGHTWRIYRKSQQNNATARWVTKYNYQYLTMAEPFSKQKQLKK